MKNSLWLNIALEKCPKCGVGDVFLKKHSLFSVPETKKNCSNCQLIYEREPGFFIGAMYVSYGLAVFQSIITYLGMSLIFQGAAVYWSIIAIATVLVLLSKKNFKWSRIIYIRIFLGENKLTTSQTTKKKPTDITAS